LRGREQDSAARRTVLQARRTPSNNPAPAGKQVDTVKISEAGERADRIGGEPLARISTLKSRTESGERENK